MPPGPGKENIYREFRARSQAQQSNASKPGKAKTAAQQGANTVSTMKNKKRGNDKDAADDAELKRRRLAAVPGAPAPDPDNDPQGGVTDADDEPERVKPKNPAWAATLWLLDPTASEGTRVALGYQEIYFMARGLARNCTEYVNHTRILTYGVNFHHADIVDRPGCVTPVCDDDVVAEELWPQWLKFFPEIKDHLDYLADNPPLIVIIGTFVAGVAAKVRSDDLGRLNDRIVDLCNLEDKYKLLVVKDNRGWQDSGTGRLLCPLRYIGKFDSDPGRFCTHIRNRLVRIFSTDYPIFLYDLSMVDNTNPIIGLLRGEVLVNCYKSIMTGKSSVYNAGSRSTRGQKSVASSYKMKSVNLHSILYVALLTRCAITGNEWSDADGKFWKAQNFVSSIMEITFTFPDWHDEIIKWWNRQIFGDENELDSDTERDLEGSAYYVIMAQQNAYASESPDDDDNNAEASGSTPAMGEAAE
ncbi:hypothetical protein LXA43DRAFT_1065090 [Ganoderma leucocontextum]|nr:hypothetical protein LXA43DRAFT_1065090 [Ganoderma leucocontextum]